MISWNCILFSGLIVVMPISAPVSFRKNITENNCSTVYAFNIQVFHVKRAKLENTERENKKGTNDTK